LWFSYKKPAELSRWLIVNFKTLATEVTEEHSEVPD
jgi:hypothetical protein